MKKDILVITTGGTFEKSYCEEEGSLSNRESQLKRHLLHRLRHPYLNVEVREIMAKDSLDMDDQDRETIFQSLLGEFPSGRPIVVLHGTDTMTKTAEHCYHKEPLPPVPIVFTGAMVPLAFVDSDGVQNFIEAVLAAQLLAPGWFVSFHSHIFTVPRVRKNLKNRTFEEV